MRESERLKEQEVMREKKVRADYVSMVRGVRKDITESGLNSVRYKLEYYERTFKGNINGVPVSEIIRAHNEGIDQYLSLLKKKKDEE